MPRPKNVIHEEAKRLGIVRYFDPRPCPKGHVAERLTSSGLCVVCNNEKTKRVYHNNPTVREKAKETSRRRHARVGTKWYRENKGRASELNKAWRENHHDEFDSYVVNWRRNNLAKLAKNANAYRAQKLQATPAWADLNAIEQIYEQAHQKTIRMGIRHVVDHIYPLVSQHVCGLHVESNLRVITHSENSRKRNSLPVLSEINIAGLEAAWTPLNWRRIGQKLGY